MELKLTVNQGHHLLNSPLSVTVDADVYSIGRGSDNSWVLPDPKLHISNKHCVIHRKNQEFHLTDISTNGVYLNGADEPLGRGRSQVLKQGDVIVIGEYTIHAVLEGHENTAVDLGDVAPTHQELKENTFFEAPQQSFSTQEQASALSTSALSSMQIDPVTMQATEERATISELLNQSHATESANAPSISELLKPIAPEKAYYVPPKVVSDSHESNAAENSQTASENVTTQAIPDNWLDIANGNEAQNTSTSTSTPNAAEEMGGSGASGAPMQADIVDNVREQSLDPSLKLSSSVKGASVEEKAQAEGSIVNEQLSSVINHDSESLADSSQLMSMIMTEAGLPLHLMQNKSAPELAQQIGRMLKQFAQGTVDTLATRTMVKSEFRLQQTMVRPLDNNPLKLSPSGDEALKIMLMADSSAYLPAETSIQEGFKDIQAHQLAMMSGIQAAFSHLLQRFEPQKLEQRFNSRPRYNKGLLGRNKADHWREYQDYYQDICAMMEDEFQDLFSNEFGKAYEQQLRKVR